jgi:hypothetical protein
VVTILVAKGIYPWLSPKLISEMSEWSAQYRRKVIILTEAKEAKGITGVWRKKVGWGREEKRREEKRREKRKVKCRPLLP